MDPASLFHELLEADRGRWMEAVPAVRSRLHELGCTYGGREMVRALRPKFLGSGAYAHLDYVCGVICGVLRRLAARALVDRRLQDFLGLDESERRLVGVEPLCPDPNALARLDGFMTPTGPRFMELNGEAPAGPGYADAACEALREHPLVAEASRRVGARSLSAAEGLLGGLLMAWRASGRSGRPRILITDYLDVPTAGEFRIIAEAFTRLGYETLVEDVRALETAEGALMAGGGAVDLVYRRALTSELLGRGDLFSNALWRAYESGSVVVVDPFRAKLLHKKAAFAALTGDHVEDGWLTPEEARVVARHVPWTRKVRETHTLREGRRIELLPWIQENRTRIVLKPNDDYGGRGVHLGWEMDAAAFTAALEEALAGDYVAQERVEPVMERFPFMDRELEVREMVVDLDPFVYFGRVHGVLARLGAGSLCNVSSGGGQVPVLVHPEP